MRVWGIPLLVILLPLGAAAAAMPGTLGAGADDFTPHGSQPDLLHALQGASDCTSCHTGAADEPHYPGASWSGSMMANATRDPLFWAALDVANADVPGVGAYCLRCHTPGGWFAGRVDKQPDGDGGFSPVDGADGCLLQGHPENGDVGGNDWRGIDCHFCHRMRDQGAAGPATALANGAVWLDDTDCDGQGEPCRAGPYDYPESGGFEPPHPWKQEPFLGDAALCGSCHDVTTPELAGKPLRTLIDGQGNDTGIPFPIERTYSEWRASDFASVVFRDGIETRTASQAATRIARGADCADCHMPQAEPAAPEQPLLACFFGPDRTGELPVHAFAGGNAWIPQVLKNEFPLLGRGDSLDWTSARATELLGTRSARVEIASQSVSADTLELSVQVTNLAGHKLPTGYGEGRRMWLALEVRDANDALVWQDGSWNAATGVLQRSAQTRVYEILQGIWDAGSGSCRIADDKQRPAFHFALNNCVAKDNRIPPAGFTGAADPELRSVDPQFAEPNSTGSTNLDLVAYQVPLPAGVVFPLEATATLRFQVASREYIDFLRDQAAERGFQAENDLCAGGPGRPFDVGARERSRGQYMHDLWNSYGRSPPTDMATATATIPD